jgi:hypothetical protein
LNPPGAAGRRLSNLESLMDMLTYQPHSEIVDFSDTECGLSPSRPDVNAIVESAFAANVPFTHLLAFGLHSLEWLASQERIGLCFRHKDGSLVAEALTPADFVRRTFETGFVPECGDPDDNCVGFDSYWWWMDDDTGIQWYSAEGCANGNGIPHAFPEAVAADEARLAQARVRLNAEREEAARQAAEERARMPAVARELTSCLVDEEIEYRLAPNRDIAKAKVRRYLDKLQPCFMKSSKCRLSARIAVMHLHFELASIVRDRKASRAT